MSVRSRKVNVAVFGGVAAPLDVVFQRIPLARALEFYALMVVGEGQSGVYMGPDYPHEMLRYEPGEYKDPPEWRVALAGDGCGEG